MISLLLLLSNGMDIYRSVVNYALYWCNQVLHHQYYKLSKESCERSEQALRRS